jgi:hypothetical protein
LDGTHVKDAIWDLGFQIVGFRNEMSERITTCENKLEEYDHILSDILSRLTQSGIWLYLFLFTLSNR